MSEQSKNTLKGYFETNDKPTQIQFENLIDSMAIQSTQTLLQTASTNWDGVYTTVNTVSGTWGGGSDPVITTLTYSPSVTTDLSTGDIFTMTLTGNVTLLKPVSGTNGKSYTWMLTQDASGSRGITLASDFKIPTTATVPLAWSTTANYTDMLAVRNINNVLYVVAMVPGYN